MPLMRLLPLLRLLVILHWTRAASVGATQPAHDAAPGLRTLQG